MSRMRPLRSCSSTSRPRLLQRTSSLPLKDRGDPSVPTAQTRVRPRTRPRQSFCATTNMPAWLPIGGKLSQISVRNGRLYGVGSNGTLWTTVLKATESPDASYDTLDKHEKETEDALASQPAPVVYRKRNKLLESTMPFASVSFDGKRVCGVTSNRDVYCQDMGSSAWQHRFSNVKFLSVNDRYFYGIDMNNEVVWREESGDKWNTLSLPIDMSTDPERIKMRGRTLCVGNRSRKMNCVKLETSTETHKWWLNGGRGNVTDFDATNGTLIWVSDSVAGVSYKSKIPLFADTNETLQYVTSDGYFICGSKMNTYEVLCSSRESKSWRSIGVNLTELSMHSGRMFGLTPTGNAVLIELAIDTEQEAKKKEATSYDSPRLTTGAIIGIVVSSLVVIMAVVGWVVLRRRRRLALFGSDEPLGSSGGMPDWASDETLLATRIPLQELKVGKKVSRGAYGDVYKGVYNGEVVAIKVLTESKRRNLAELDKFAQEARFMALLQHEHIARFIGAAWNSPSQLCIVTEYLGGGDLRTLLQQYLTEGRPEGFSPKKIKIALHVAHALTYLHSLQPIVLHRDLKSKNILLTQTGDAKLTDFGVSREFEDATMTAGVGSSLWMAPEVFQGERYDEKADIYSFGVVLSELDTNDLPFAEAQREGVVVTTRNDKGSSEKKRLHEVAVLQLVAQGRLSVRFSESAHPTLREIGEACVSVDSTLRPTAAEVLYKIHQIWRETSALAA
ncbi:hypothetical protein PINS_up015743 [Pythium insidiosum]|nr:hypothetical protein PINS_up015743 [Pythium insidiosum]